MRKLNTEELTLVYGGHRACRPPKPPKPCRHKKHKSGSSDSRDGCSKGRGKSSSS